MTVRTASTGRMLSIMLIALAPAAGAQEPFPAAALRSVVSVLPVWPGYPGPRQGRRAPGDEPEGSAVAIRAGGYLITALHIVDRAASVSVRLADGRIIPAEVRGKDPMTDLALLKIGRDLPVLPPGPEPALGARVCAVANQFGLGLSVTCGVVSATRRAGTGFNRIEDFIQTDAAVNPGASGGALLDAKGRLVGIVSAIFTKRSDANIGINFAASAELVNRVVGDLIAHGHVVRGNPGLSLRPLSRARRATIVGALVQAVAPGGAARKAGFERGDVITRIGRRRIASPNAAIAAIHLHRAGEPFEVEVLRGDARKTLRMEMPPRPSN